MGIRSVAIVGAAVLLGAVVVVPRLLTQRGGDPPAPGPAAQPQALVVDVVRVEPRRIAERLSTTGTIRANEQVDVVSEITGVVRRIRFREGAPVERGDVLVEIDDTELTAQRDRVVYRLGLAETRERRQRELRDQGITSEQEYDIASGELGVLQAELRLVDAELAKTRITAPFSGVVGLRYVSEGALVTPSMRIASLQDLDPAKIDFTLPEKYAGRIGPGTRVEFRVKESDRPREAEVYAVEPRIDAETRSLLIRARAPNPGRKLVPGAFADVTLAVSEVPDALVVPSLAVVPELGGKKVFVVEDGKAAARRIETGIRGDTDVQVTSGLEVGDLVIVSAIQRLRPGVPVEPAAEGPGPGPAPTAAP